ncbi:hypothetical protein ABIA30_003735 [Mycobacterium sp. MAA66]|uniref:hypothetical protein n=1 Tax=Mycobacterium sp. MAA66 TaxID=3156297 RepID=UPI003515817E
MELRDRLLGLNNPARPWLIRDGAGEEVDLVAQWKSDDPDWRQVLEDLSVVLTFQVHLRLDVEAREVHAVDRLVEWRRDPEDPRHWLEFHDTGDLHLSWSGNSNCQHYLITTDDIKVPIQGCAADAGWVYRVDVV